jgi:hypothetical protein
MKSTLKIFSILCSIVIFDACKNGDSDLPTHPTFNEHVAAIIYQNCTPCHRNGGAAPFNLTNYKEVWRKKKTIRKVTQSGYMPPWPADANYSHFKGEKILSEKDKAIIKLWVDNNGPEGPKDKIYPLPQYSEWSTLGKPDLVLYLDSIFIDGDNRDRFLITKIPYLLPSDTFIRAIEFVAGRKNLVHHMNGHLLSYDWEAKKNVFEGNRVINLETESDEAYLALFNGLKLYNDDNSKPMRIHSAVNYLPGVEAQIYPDGIGGFKVKRKGAIVANDIHYGPIPKGQWDRSHINLFFAPKAPERITLEMMLGTNGIAPIEPPLVIPPNQIKKFITRYKVETDISLLTINPHLHLLGQSFLAYAVKPTGDTIRLISIPHWDFKWQYFYTFKNMLPIPAGSIIVVEAVFDNTSNNPYNPNNPPKTVSERLDRGGAGMRTTDEMLQFIITYLPYKAGDENISLE